MSMLEGYRKRIAYPFAMMCMVKATRCANSCGEVWKEDERMIGICVIDSDSYKSFQNQ